MAVTPVSVPNSFSPSTVAQSGQVNANFTALVNAFNNGTMGLNAATKGHVYLSGGVLLQWQKVASVAADGSVASTPTWDVAFPTALWGVFASVSNAYQTTNWHAVAQTDSETLAGCNLNVAGGPAGQTVSVWLFAIGN